LSNDFAKTLISYYLKKHPASQLAGCLVERELTTGQEGEEYAPAEGGIDPPEETDTNTDEK